MRALAASSVLVLHCWLYSDPRGPAPDVGWPATSILPHLGLGVTLFFALSAFLLYRPFAGPIVRNEPLPGVRTYLRNRAFRILPAHWAILFIVALALGAGFVSSGLEHVSPLHQPRVLAADAFLVQGYFPSTVLTGIQPEWSLGVEVVFYLALPLLVLLAATIARRATTRMERRLAALAPALVLFLIGISGKLMAASVVTGGTGWDGTWHSVLIRSFWGQADLFTFGILVAVLRVEAEDGQLRLPRWWRTAVWISVLVIALPTMKFVRTDIHAYAYDTLMALALALLLVLVVIPGPRASTPRLVRLLESRPLVATGVISYSLFLWHEPIARWLEAQGLTFAGSGGFAVNLVVLFTIAWLLSAVTYRYVELPALLRKTGRPAMKRITEPVPAHQVQAAP
jgi:peptidoglycan/LPS O-acetylase OafA/YrhL